MALYSYGLYGYGLYSYGPYSYGPYSYGLYSYGLCSCGLHLLAVARLVSARCGRVLRPTSVSFLFFLFFYLGSLAWFDTHNIELTLLVIRVLVREFGTHKALLGTPQHSSTCRHRRHPTCRHRRHRLHTCLHTCRAMQPWHYACRCASSTSSPQDLSHTHKGAALVIGHCTAQHTHNRAMRNTRAGHRAVHGIYLAIADGISIAQVSPRRSF